MHRLKQQMEQISAANQQTEAANAVITNASAVLQAIQGQADENGMISAESLSAVIGSLAGADAGVSGVSGIGADAYTGQAQQIAASAAEQIAGAQSTLNSTASQLEQAASGLSSGADTLGSKAGEMSSGASQMQAARTKWKKAFLLCRKFLLIRSMQYQLRWISFVPDHRK